MKPVRALAALLLLGGCVVPEHRSDIDPHRDWWMQRHPQAASYDPDYAQREHREWCKRWHDQSCEGW